jgi:hypothetical protein
MEFRPGILLHSKGCYLAIRPEPRATVQNTHPPFNLVGRVHPPLRRRFEHGGQPKFYGHR